MTATYRLIHGDSLEELRQFGAGEFSACVTDGPYGIRFMGNGWDGRYIEKTVDRKMRTEPRQRKSTKDGTGIHEGRAFAAGEYDQSLTGNRAFQEFSRQWATEIFRVLKPGGWMVAFASPRTYHRMVCGIEDAGFEVRDTLMWVFGSGFPKSSNQDGDWEGWGTALKPAYEPICLARKPFPGTVPENLAAHGTGALNVDDCRVVSEQGVEGRWPPNFCHDGSDEVLDGFPVAPGAVAPVRGTEPSAASNGTRCFNKFARTANSVPRIETEVSAGRFFYCAKASRADRNAGCDMLKKRPLLWSSGEANPGSFQSEGTDKSAQNFHPTVKPTALMRWLVRLVTPPGGKIIDQFGGSGSTGRAAILEGFDCVMIEREEEYLPIIRARCDDALRIAAEPVEQQAELLI